ncbi:dCTP deaminase domain-containing protein [Myroides odoratimimus]|uniref:dCTP deaminase domain-containing protein n=1 Tax=Myroides odoratimimus TaxID=76832 RepID=UPI001CE12BFE|nr:deoxycytidine triphosphate deaminase [Myroides odoratimimus]MCA4793913.1 deoxycytidine triphosphate deaminase [Myroides odoratimimus]MCA4821187.1 deoxycytidine triphosphate deaminase [Myroides odoratimimus]MDM1504206.1 deoxycytidine triphosphate deaminase [Myroides odoratimimus]
MAFLGPTELKKVLSDKLIITDGNGNNVYNEKRVEEAAYALSLGSEGYRTDNKDRKIEILDEKSRTIEINPGQFTLLMTDEYVCIPKDKLAFISIKAKQKLKGLINVSGFHVDPGFEGKLLFSVYNAGPSTITLETKKPYFLIWFSNLESEAVNGDEYNGKNHHQGQKNIPLDYVDVLKQGDLTSPKALYDKLVETKSDLEKKIDDKNRKVLNNEYILKAILGLFVAIFIRYLFLEVPKTYYIQQIENKDSTITKLNKNLGELEKKILYLYQRDSLKEVKPKDAKDK